MQKAKLELVIDAIQDGIRELEELDDTFEVYGCDKVIRKLRKAEYELTKELEAIETSTLS